MSKVCSHTAYLRIRLCLRSKCENPCLQMFSPVVLPVVPLGCRSSAGCCASERPVKRLAAVWQKTSPHCLSHTHTSSRSAEAGREKMRCFCPNTPHLSSSSLASSSATVPRGCSPLSSAPITGAPDGPRCARRPGAAPRPGEVLKVFRDKAFGLRLGLCTFVMEN